MISMMSAHTTSTLLRRDSLLSKILTKLVSTKSAAMGIALLLTVCGCTMIFQNIRDDGFIDIKTPFITGKAKSGFVGVLLIMGSLVITVSAVLCGTVVARSIANKDNSRASGKNQKLKVKIGNRSLEWEGQLTFWEESDHVGCLLETVQRSLLRGGPDDQKRLKERRERPDATQEIDPLAPSPLAHATDRSSRRESAA
jgi:hypothetical protein